MSGLLTGNGRGSLEGFCLSLCEPTLLEDFDREVARHGLSEATKSNLKQHKATIFCNLSPLSLNALGQHLDGS